MMMIVNLLLIIMIVVMVVVVDHARFDEKAIRQYGINKFDVEDEDKD